MKSISSFNDFVERQQKENQKNWSLNQKGQKIQLIGLEQDIQDLHKEEQEIQTKCELNKRLQDLELALQQERKLRQEAEHALQQEKQQKRAIEHDLQQERQQRQTDRQELLSSMEDNFVLLGENLANSLDLLDVKKCKICLVNEAEILFTPCNHIVACEVCVGKLRNQAVHGKCPYCNIAYTKTTKVYIV